MHAGCCIGSLGMSLYEGLRFASRAGFGLVEVDWSALERQALGRDGSMAALRGLMRDYCLGIAGVYAGSISAERVDQLHLQVVRLKEILKKMGEIGCHICIVSAGPRTLENYNTVRDVLLETAEAGVETGATLVLANKVSTRVEDQRDLLALFMDRSMEKVGICLDVYQFHLATVNPSEVVLEHGRRIRYVRIGDALGSLAAPLGRGELELRSLIASLSKAGYEGPIMADSFPPAAREDRLKQLQEALQYLESLFPKEG